LTKTGTGTQILSGANTYTGTTTISAGTLQIGNGSTTGTLSTSSAIVDNATLSFNRTNTVTQGTDFSGAAITGTGGVTQAGTGTLTLNAANTFTGNIVINSGTIAVGSGIAGTANAHISSNLGDIGSGQSRTITINNGGNLTFTGGNVFGYDTATLSTITLVVNQGGVFQTGPTSGSGYFSKIGAVNLNGGTISVGNGDNGYHGALALLGMVTVGGSTPSTIGTLSGASTNDVVNIGQSNAGISSVTFNVADVTGDSGADLTVSAGLANQANASAASSITKTGAGTMALTATNTFTGGTTINQGTLALGNAAALSTSSGGISFGGGTLQYGSGITTDYSSRIAAGTSGSAVAVDTNGNNVTFATALTSSQSGGLTKLGAGTLTLTANNLLTGTKTVSGGTLLLSGSGQLNGTGGITVNGSGAKFVQANTTNAVTPTVTLTQGTIDGTGTINTVNVANLAGNTITNGNGSTGTLTIGTLAFTGAGTLSVNEAGTTKGLGITTLTTANIPSGEITVNATNSSSWSNGTTYNLLSYSSITGTLADFTKGTIGGISGRQSATLGLDTTNKNLTLAIAGDNPVWTGTGSQTWTTVASNNNTGPNAWALKTGHTATNFWASDAVEFNDTYDLGSGSTAVANSTVTITGGVAPVSTTFNNSSVNYTVNSSDSTGITAGTLSKSGTGTVTINTANSYTGATTINNGTLVTAAGSLGGTASIAVTGGTLNAVNYNSAATLTVGASGTANISGTGLSLAAVSNANSVSFTGATGTTTLASLSGAGSTNFASNATITSGGISTGTVTVSGLLTSDISGGTVNAGSLAATSVTGGTNGITGAAAITTVNGGTTTVGGVATVGTLTSGTLNLNGATSAITTLNGGTINLGSSTALTVNAGTSAGSITGSGGSLVKASSGTLTLNGSNSYTGGTTVNSGTLSVGNVGALGSGALTLNGGNVNANSSAANFGSAITNNIVVNGSVGFYCGNKDATYSGAITGSGTLDNGVAQAGASLSITGDLSGFTGTLAYTSGGNYNNVNIGGSTAASMDLSHAIVSVSGSGPSGQYRTLNLGGSGSTTFKVGDLSGTSGYVKISAATLEVGNLGLNSSFGGVFADNNGGVLTAGVTKVGTGTWTLSGTNTYTGATTVTNGKLIVNGSISTSAVTVQSGGTLGGTGTVGSVTVQSGGYISPGNSPGILTVNGNYSQAGTLIAELNGITAGTTYDQVNVVGTVTLTGALNATVGYTPVNNQLLFILVNDGTDAISGTFAGLADGSTFTADGKDWKISYQANYTGSNTGTFTGGNDIALMAIPEPRAALLGGLGMLMLLRRRRQ
jgi:autotransporter-associated beta strand protein